MEPLPNKIHLLLAFTGSVATIKLKDLLTLLTSSNKFDIKIMVTENALKFIDKDSIFTEFPEISKNFYSDINEWGIWKKKGDPVLHIDLRKWADILLIAPLSANTLAKIANGICDNLVTCVIRAWDFETFIDKNGMSSSIPIENKEFQLLKKPIVIAPAMNSYMWNNIFTKKHLQQCRELNIIAIDPISKILVCGDQGIGAMAEPSTIVGYIMEISQRISMRD